MTAVPANLSPPRAADPVRERSEREFDELYAASFQGLTLQMYAYLGNLAEAQDVVQEAFCRAYVRWRAISGYDDPIAWVRRVAWNLATSSFRRQKTALNFLRRSREPVADGPQPDRVALSAALAQLPPNQRKVVVLHYLGQLSVLEIAEQEGVPEGTVKSWLSRGRASLATLLTKEDAR